MVDNGSFCGPSVAARRGYGRPSGGFTGARLAFMMAPSAPVWATVKAFPMAPLKDGAFWIQANDGSGPGRDRSAIAFDLWSAAFVGRRVLSRRFFPNLMEGISCYCDVVRRRFMID